MTGAGALARAHLEKPGLKAVPPIPAGDVWESGCRGGLRHRTEVPLGLKQGIRLRSGGRGASLGRHPFLCRAPRRGSFVDLLILGPPCSTVSRARPDLRPHERSRVEEDPGCRPYPSIFATAEFKGQPESRPLWRAMCKVTFSRGSFRLILQVSGDGPTGFFARGPRAPLAPWSDHVRVLLGDDQLG